MKKFNYKRYIEAIGILENNKNMGCNCKDSYLQKNTIGVTTFYTATIEMVIFYTEIFTGKVVLWCFFSSEMSEKIHNSTFQVKISI